MLHQVRRSVVASTPSRLALALVAAAAVAGCRQDDSPSTVTETTGPAFLTVNPDAIHLSYVCGNRFTVRNENADEVVVSYEVVGTAEQGTLTLPAPVSPATYTDTPLTTVASGTVRLVYEGAVIEEVANGGTACPPEPSSVGEWSSLFSWPDVAIHISLLPTGKVLTFGRAGEPYVWDPATNTFTIKPITSDIFCSAHAFLPDGRLLVVGGRYTADNLGIPDVNIFNPFTEAWEPAPPMRHARWYPTATLMGNGEVVVTAGTDENGVHVGEPEVWTGSGWRSLSGAVMKLPFYPKTYVAPGGLLYYSGELPRTRFLNPTGTGSWKYSVRTNYNLERSYGGGVMYEYGKILLVGGNKTAPTNTAEIIDLNKKPLAWQYTSPMTFARRQTNAVVLADGKVLVLGGTSGAGFNNPVGQVYTPELWDPATGAWTPMADAARPRIYHSTALLMPDGRVLFTGSGGAGSAIDELNAEFFSPPYLFKGPRPVITSAPSQVPYNSTAFVATPDAASITKVAWIRLGSVTHSFDMNARYITMAFTQVTGGLSVKTNKGRAALPPGHYTMFLLNGNGVPSEGKIIKIY